MDERQEILILIDEACRAGCRRKQACQILGLSVRTTQRWQNAEAGDRRKHSRAQPGNALSADERIHIQELLISKPYRDLSPNQIVPSLADQGIYLASESTFYRLLREQRMTKHRQTSQAPTHRRPLCYTACAPNQVWTWDISYLPSSVKGWFFYLYLIVDVYSRKIVAWQIHHQESAEQAADLVKQACFVERISQDQIVLHSDNGSPMKGATMLATLQMLGVIPSFSRPSVSNDNPFSESLFRTLKYRPEYPHKPFNTIHCAREWMSEFVQWYNEQHLHSAIRFVTPSNRHNGADNEILKQREIVYKLAKRQNPERWSGNIRNWSPINEVVLNKSGQKTTQPLKKAASLLRRQLA